MRTSLLSSSCFCSIHISIGLFPKQLKFLLSQIPQSRMKDEF
jgi:hypothetical protein